MVRILLADAQAWAEATKLNLSALDLNLLNQTEEQIIIKLQSCGIDTTTIATWTDNTNTPTFIKSIIAMYYVAWVYDRQYSEEQSGGNDYAAMLRQHAQMLLDGICSGTVELPGVPSTAGEPAFFPTDDSSATQPTELTPSDGGPYFFMSRGF